MTTTSVRPCPPVKWHKSDGNQSQQTAEPRRKWQRKLYEGGKEKPRQDVNSIPYEKPSLKILWKGTWQAVLVRPETTQELLSFPSHITVLNQQKHPLYTGRHSKQMLTKHLIEKGENKVISKDQECGERDTALKCFWKAKKKENHACHTLV